MVQVMKRPLRKILRTHQLKFRELKTILTEIERMMNDRPISALVVDPNEPSAFPPCDLLYGYSSRSPLPESKQIIADTEAAPAIVFSAAGNRSIRFAEVSGKISNRNTCSISGRLITMSQEIFGL